MVGGYLGKLITSCNDHAIESSKEWQPKGRLQIIAALYLQLSHQGEFEFQIAVQRNF